MLGAVADEAQGAFLLAITGVHHVHVQPSNARAQWVVRCVAGAALYLGTNALPAHTMLHWFDGLHVLWEQAKQAYVGKCRFVRGEEGMLHLMSPETLMILPMTPPALVSQVFYSRLSAAKQ